MSTEGGTKAVVAALTANLFIAVTKFGAWALTGASSMLAEAVHSVGGTLEWGPCRTGGFRVAARIPDAGATMTEAGATTTEVGATMTEVGRSRRSCSPTTRSWSAPACG